MATMTSPTLSDPLLLRHQPYIDGTWASDDAEHATVTDPATGDSIVEVALGTATTHAARSKRPLAHSRRGPR